MAILFIIEMPALSYAGDTGEPKFPVSDADFLYYHHDDHLGSSHILTEGKATARHSGLVYKKGEILQRFEYAPFGKEVYVLNPNLKFDPSYTGQTYDIESGLYYYKSRYYNPILSRFIQADTVVPDAKNLQAYNRYSYVNNNPLKYIDPSGHGILDFFKKIGEAIGDFFEEIGAALAWFFSTIFSVMGHNASIPEEGGAKGKVIDDEDEKKKKEELEEFEGGDGLVSYSGRKRQFGTRGTVESLHEIGRKWRAAGNTDPIQIGDMSYEDGRPMETRDGFHARHREGLDVDIRPGHIPGHVGAVGPYEKNPVYSAEQTQAIVDAFKKDPRVGDIYFNDRNIKGVTPQPGHDNHMHVRFKE